MTYCVCKTLRGLLSLRLQATKFHIRSKGRPFVRGHVYVSDAWLLCEVRWFEVQIDAGFVLFLIVKTIDQEDIMRFYTIAFPPKVLFVCFQ